MFVKLEKTEMIIHVNANENMKIDLYFFWELIPSIFLQNKEIFDECKD